MKRFISLVFCLSMFLALMPVELQAQHDDQTPYPPIPNHLEAVDSTWDVITYDTVRQEVSISQLSMRRARNESGEVLYCDGDPNCVQMYPGTLTLTDEVEVVVPKVHTYTQRVLVPRDGFTAPPPVPELPTLALDLVTTTVAVGDRSVALGEVTVEEGGTLLINTGDRLGATDGFAAGQQGCCPGASYTIGYNHLALGLEHSSLTNNHRFSGYPNTQETALVVRFQGEFRKQAEIQSLDGLQEVKMSPLVVIGGVELRGTVTSQGDPDCGPCIDLDDPPSAVTPGFVVRPYGGIMLDPPGWLGGLFTLSYDVLDTNTRGRAFGPAVDKAALARLAVTGHVGRFDFAIGAQANLFCFWEQSGAFVNLSARFAGNERNNKYPFDPFGAWGRK